MNIKQKARILVATVALFAVVGGTYAAKALRGKNIYCSTTTGVIGVLKPDFTITDVNHGVASFCSIDQANNVVATHIIAAE